MADPPSVEQLMFGDFELRFTTSELTNLFLTLDTLLDSPNFPDGGRITDDLRSACAKMSLALTSRVVEAVNAAGDEDEVPDSIQRLVDAAVEDEDVLERIMQELMADAGDEPFSALWDLDDDPDWTPDWLLRGDRASLAARESPTLRKWAAWVDQLVVGVLRAEHVGIPVPEGMFFPDGLFTATEIVRHPDAYESFVTEIRHREAECVLMWGRGNVITEDHQGTLAGIASDHVMFHFRDRDGHTFGFTAHQHNDRPGCNNPSCINVHSSYHILAGDMRLTDPEASFLRMVFPGGSA